MCSPTPSSTAKSVPSGDDADFADPIAFTAKTAVQQDRGAAAAAVPEVAEEEADPAEFTSRAMHVLRIWIEWTARTSSCRDSFSTMLMWMPCVNTRIYTTTIAQMQSMCC